MTVETGQIDDWARDTFRRGYRTAMIWANTYDFSDNELSEVEATEAPDWCDSQLSDRVRAELNQQADDFLADEDVARMLVKVCGDIEDPYDWGQAGHDFALTRAGHGAGYWDRGLDDGDALTTAAESWGPATLDAVHADNPKTWEVMEG